VSLVLVNNCLFYVFLHGFFTFQIINFTITQRAVGENAPIEPFVRFPSERILSYYTTISPKCKYILYYNCKLFSNSPHFFIFLKRKAPNLLNNVLV
jgi:hypothetical protein